MERWFLELRAPVLQYLRNVGCGEPLAEEIAQEAFLRLHQRLIGGLQADNVRGWIFRVVRNLWIDTTREHQRYGMPGQNDQNRWHHTARDSAPDPERQVLDRELVRIIERETLRLPTLQRECMRLKAQGLRYHEIASVLNIPMPAAVYAVRRAVERLKRFLDR